MSREDANNPATGDAKVVARLAAILAAGNEVCVVAVAAPEGVDRSTFESVITDSVREADYVGVTEAADRNLAALALVPTPVVEIGPIATRLRRRLIASVQQTGTPWISVGISAAPQDAGSPAELIEKAKVAARYADRTTTCPIQRFKPCMRVAIDREAALGRQLAVAVRERGLALAYQPQIDISTGACMGFEALVRWDDPKLGAVSPARFIPVAERLGLINEITEWVITTSCAQLHEWQRQGFDPRMSINLSAHDLQSPALLPFVERTLSEFSIPPGRIELEITEGVLIENFEFSADLITELKRLGVSIALDDFGTGYSSLGYLREISIDTLKLDRSFIRDMLSDWNSAAITSCVITLAQVLGLRVIAEGVETREQLETLREHACDEAQGHLFSMPMSAAAAHDWLRQGGHHNASH